jgi:hypothetical protein
MKFEKVNSATGAASPGFSRGTDKYSGNQHMKTNSDALINKGRGPTVGNKSDRDSTYPGADSMPAFKAGKDMFTGKAQYRGQGGVEAKCPPNADKINVGRGPTKGNQR